MRKLKKKIKTETRRKRLEERKYRGKDWVASGIHFGRSDSLKNIAITDHSDEDHLLSIGRSLP